MVSQQNIVDYLVLSVVGRLVTWSHFDVGRKSMNGRVFDASRNAHEHAASFRMDFNYFPETPACYTCLALPLGVIMPPLRTIRSFTESALWWTVEDQGATDCGSIIMNEKVHFVNQVCNI